MQRYLYLGSIEAFLVDNSVHNGFIFQYIDIHVIADYDLRWVDRHHPSKKHVKRSFVPELILEFKNINNHQGVLQ